MTKVFKVDVFGGDCTTTVGIFSSLEKARQGIMRDFKLLGYDLDGFMLKEVKGRRGVTELETYERRGTKLVMYAVPQETPDISMMEAESDLCLVYSVTSFTLDRRIPIVQRTFD